MSKDTLWTTPQHIQKILDTLVPTAQAILKSQPDIDYPAFQTMAFDACEEYQLDQQNHGLDPEREIFHCQWQALAEQLALPKNLAETSNVKHHRFRIAIIGGGTAGLLCGYALAKAGHNIQIFERRSLASATLRVPNISFKEAESRLRPLVGEPVYQAFFQRGASLDGNTGKLRISIGAFQEVLIDALKVENAEIHYEHATTVDECVRHSDMVLIATGVHSFHRMNLQETLQVQRYPEYTAYGRTALFVNASDEPHGYTREERQGRSWRRVNKTVYGYDKLGPDIQRVICNLEKACADKSCIEKIQSLHQHSNIEYNFIFGNDQDDFLEGIEGYPERQPIIECDYKVEPMISLNPVFIHEHTPVIAIGDATGSPHPLAAIGTLKFLKNVDCMREYAQILSVCKHLENTVTLSAAQQEQLEQLRQQARQVYCIAVLKNIKHIFFANILSSVFSTG